ncbi:MAG: magnesium and cobalt transport protein CorA [Bacteroidetes bacterium RIFCSPHIGHO2_02_FULL_44_7]|nr:MAG: magnesium and cobalt transport protein CorA [Bacteroidetes bacterium RIFCSPHIGHO2_02_FULL_44_7]
MQRYARKPKEEIGRSPYDIVFLGDKKMEHPIIQCIDFDGEKLLETQLNSVEEILPFFTSKQMTWINIDGLHDIEFMEQLAEGLGLDRMIFSVIADTSSRPKLLEYDNCLFLSLKMLHQPVDKKTLLVENISIILTPHMLITFQERPGDVFDPVRERIRKGKTRIRIRGTDYLLAAIIDVVIDNYIYVIGTLGEKIEGLESRLLPEPHKSVINQISHYKRELNFVRRNIQPAEEVIYSLNKLESYFIQEKTKVHYRDLKDNVSLARDTSETYREILSDQLSIYHTIMSTKLNDVMKFLTIFSVIFIPLTFIAGIYGTNFDVLPELHFKYSYFIMWAIMVVIAVGMLMYFKRKRWL